MAEKESKELTTRSKQEISKPEEQTRPGRFFVPDVNIYEFNESLKLWADMPGVKQGDVEVTLKDGVLTLIGRISTDMYENLRPMYTEYNVGNYYRQFVLHEDIDESKIKAKLCNGVLEVELPKKEQAKPRRIEVTAA
jgi:HSP20 family protein